MGYQAESGPWRNAYLMGAAELRRGVIAETSAPLSLSVVNAMTLDQYFDYMGLRFNAPQTEQNQLSDATINWIVSSADGSSQVLLLDGATGLHAAIYQL